MDIKRSPDGEKIILKLESNRDIDLLLQVASRAILASYVQHETPNPNDVFVQEEGLIPGNKIAGGVRSISYLIQGFQEFGSPTTQFKIAQAAENYTMPGKQAHDLLGLSKYAEEIAFELTPKYEAITGLNLAGEEVSTTAVNIDMETLLSYMDTPPPEETV